MIIRKDLVVMKFGGTSVEDAAAISRTAGIIEGRIAKGLRVFVVVSAMARVTDSLLSAATAAGHGDRSGALAINARLRMRHIEAVVSLLGQAPGKNIAADLNHEFDALDELLRGISAVGELTPRTTDLVVSFGERLSSRIVAGALLKRGIAGTHLDARTIIITDNLFGKATPLQGEIEKQLTARALPLIEAGQTPVIGGFIGATTDGITTTLGRGGSDFSAALVGGGLHAGTIEIWTDVDGIMTTDPRICADALRVKTVSFEEAAELAYFGAKVLHPSTILPAVQQNIPVYVLNSRNPLNEGTRITAVAPPCRSPFKCIAVKRRLTIVDIVASRMLMSHGYLKAVFDVFDRHRLAIDMVATSEVSISVTVDTSDRLPAIAEDLSKLADVKYESNKALICMVGEDIRGHNGVAGKVFTAVQHVNVRMISQGASEINMSFMIEEEDVEEAVQSLHRAFFNDPDREIFDTDTRVRTMAK